MPSKGIAIESAELLYPVPRGEDEFEDAEYDIEIRMTPFPHLWTKRKRGGMESCYSLNNVKWRFKKETVTDEHRGEEGSEADDE